MKDISEKPTANVKLAELPTQQQGKDVCPQHLCSALYQRS